MKLCNNVNSMTGPETGVEETLGHCMDTSILLAHYRSLCMLLFNVLYELWGDQLR